VSEALALNPYCPWDTTDPDNLNVNVNGVKTAYGSSAATAADNGLGHPVVLTSTACSGTIVRVATTTDGVNFTDVGPASGLFDPTTVKLNETRYLGSGNLLRLGNGPLRHVLRRRQLPR
jgi:hypothetical protein